MLLKRIECVGNMGCIRLNGKLQMLSSVLRVCFESVADLCWVGLDDKLLKIPGVLHKRTVCCSWMC